MREIIYGRNPVREALLSMDVPVEKLYIPETGLDEPIVQLRRLADKRGIPCRSADKIQLDRLSGGGNHQGVVLKIAARQYQELDSLLSRDRGEPHFFLACFQIQDPHNLGSLLRTCDGTGVHGVIIPKNKSVGLTPIVSKVASGADAYIPVSRVSGIYDAVLEMKQRGIKVIGTCSSGARDYREADYSGPLCILLGSEGRGLDRRLRSVCDEMIHIPLKGHIESLNVGVAGGLILYEASNQRSPAGVR